jgi:hypothetical protein
LEGAFMAASGDPHGTMIEVYPEQATLDIPKNDDQVVFGNNASPPETWPFHVLLSVPLKPEQIGAIGAREGWRAKTFGRGMRGHKPFFHVIEFWLENRLMIEVVSPEMAREYQDFLSSARTEVMGDPEAVRLDARSLTERRRPKTMQQLPMKLNALQMPVARRNTCRFRPFFGRPQRPNLPSPLSTASSDQEGSPR